MEDQITNSDYIPNEAPAEEIQDKVKRLSVEGYSFDMSIYLNEAYGIIRHDMVSFIAYTVVYLLIIGVLSAIPVVGSLINVLISPALSVGFALVAYKIDRKESYSFSDFFGGFSYYSSLVATNILVAILVLLGLLVLIIPGIYLAVAYSLASMFVIFAGTQAWESMELSRQVVSKNWFSFLLFFLVLGLINLAGILALGVGILFTIPLSGIAIYSAYKHIVGID